MFADSPPFSCSLFYSPEFLAPQTCAGSEQIVYDVTSKGLTYDAVLGLRHV